MQSMNILFKNIKNLYIFLEGLLVCNKNSRIFATQNLKAKIKNC